jgi:hypothetical protein
MAPQKGRKVLKKGYKFFLIYVYIMIILKDNLVKMSNNNVVIGMGVKSRKNVSKVDSLTNTINKINLVSGTGRIQGMGLVNNVTSVKRKPINFL